MEKPAAILTPEQIETYQRDGVLVVPNVLTDDEVREALRGLQGTLARFGVDTNNLQATGHNLKHLSSTNGSGGVLDLFYEEWKIAGVAVHPTLFQITTELWRAAYCHENEQREDIFLDKLYQWHPYGAFDCNRGYMYLDRIGYRLPTKLAEELGARLANNGNNTKSTKKKKKPPTLQRSLTPHLDCCPDTFFSTDSATKNKWRPIQCFVSLTDSLEPNHGGFEVAKGFHREFDEWTKQRPPTIVTRRHKKGGGHDDDDDDDVQVQQFPAPCIGEYTHIRPKEDWQVMQCVQHVPVPAGAAVFWDNRIPHANAYRHDGSSPRAVVYCSFLPDIALNRTYVINQLLNWKQGRNPTDQWINNVRDDADDTATKGEICCVDDVLPTLLARKLAGVVPWDDTS